MKRPPPTTAAEQAGRALDVPAGAPDVVIVGSVSSDRLRPPAAPEIRTVGGAGLYASLGAAAAGARVGLVGLYSDDLDYELVNRLRNYLNAAGLIRVPGRLLHFDIAYDSAGHAEYVLDGADAEELIAYQLVPEVYARAAGFHLCPTGRPAAQLAMAQAIRSDPRAVGAMISATTLRNRITAEPTVVHALWSLVDVLVCNAEEAMLLTEQDNLAGARSRVAEVVRERGRGAVVITHGVAGAEIVTTQAIRHVASYPSPVVDPTGAGESFAGALIAAHLAGADLLRAAATAAAVASIAVEGVGPARLLGADRRDVRHRAGLIGSVNASGIAHV